LSVLPRSLPLISPFGLPLAGFPASSRWHGFSNSDFKSRILLILLILSRNWGSDDIFFHEQGRIVKMLEVAHVAVTWITVHSGKGHDSFLLERGLFSSHIAQILA